MERAKAGVWEKKCFDRGVSGVKQSMKIPFCGMVAALSVTVMFLTGLIPVATLALPALAGCFLIPVVGELGVRWGFSVYAVCAVLSFLLAPDREAALCYLLFFGCYPVLTAIFGRVQNKLVRVVLKLLLFNAAAVSEGLLTVYVLGIPWESMDFLGNLGIPLLLLLANVMFLLYDRALGGLIFLYFRKFSRQVRRILNLK